jgi:hypothetical protein
MIKIKPLNSCHPDAEGSEIVIKSVVVDGKRIPPKELFSGEWIKRGYYLIWNNYSNITDNILTGEIPQGKCRYIEFQSNKWRGCVDIISGEKQCKMDCYSPDCDDGSLIMYL